MVMILIWSTAVFFLVLFQCGVHFKFLWSSAKNMVKHCLTAAPPEFFNASVDVATDIVILSLPVYWVSIVLSVLDLESVH